MNQPLLLVLATANPDKAAEISAVIADACGDAVVLVARPEEVDEVDETADSLLGNARLKALALMEATGEAAVADDTGLEVDALGGEPGVRSSRYAGGNASYDDNVTKLLDALDAAGAHSAAQRRARFRTVAVVVFPDGAELHTEGIVEGAIALERRGADGFGYDPVFVPDGASGRTFAEMSAAEKNAVSHRGQAFRRLAQALGARSLTSRGGRSQSGR